MNPGNAGSKNQTKNPKNQKTKKPKQAQERKNQNLGEGTGRGGRALGEGQEGHPIPGLHSLAGTEGHFGLWSLASS